jgi:hypothetical protein
VGSSVAPAALEAIQQPAVRQKRQSLESHMIMGGNADVGMNALTCNFSTAGDGGDDGNVFQIDRVAHLGDMAAGRLQPI